MTSYHVDVTDKSKEEVNRIAKRIYKAFPQLTDGYNSEYYDILMNCTLYEKTLCWEDTGDFLCWGGSVDMFPVKYSAGVNNLGEM